MEAMEGDGVKFPWTYAPHGVKGDKSSQVMEGNRCIRNDFVE